LISVGISAVVQDKESKDKDDSDKLEWRFCNISQRASAFLKVIGGNWHMIYASEAWTCAWFDSSDEPGFSFSLTVSN
jgi:hypothetical protein